MEGQKSLCRSKRITSILFLARLYESTGRAIALTLGVDVGVCVGVDVGGGVSVNKNVKVSSKILGPYIS